MVRSIHESWKRNDNKPLTVRELVTIFNQIKNQDHPITMASDEEGDEMLKLWSVDVTKTGPFCI